MPPILVLMNNILWIIFKPNTNRHLSLSFFPLVYISRNGFLGSKGLNIFKTFNMYCKVSNEKGLESV